MGDLEKAEKFYITGTSLCHRCISLCLSDTPTGTGSTSIKIYSVNPTTKGPQNLLGSSITIPTNTLNAAAGKLIKYHFSTSVPVSTAFFASFVIDQAPDTVAVLSSKEGCWSHDSLAWEKESSSGWYSMYHAWGGSQMDWQFSL